MVSTWPKKESGANRQIGPRETNVMLRAAGSPSGQIIIMSKDNASWCAAKRLVQRGLMARRRFGSDAIGWIAVYELTRRGREKLRETGAWRR